MLRGNSEVEAILEERQFRYVGRSNGIVRYARDPSNHVRLFDDQTMELTLDGVAQRYNSYREFAKALRKKYPKLANRR